MLLEELVCRGGLTDRQSSQLDGLFVQPGYFQVHTARALWCHRGEPVTRELLRVLPSYLETTHLASAVLDALAAMGSVALPALPAVNAAIAEPGRRDFETTDPDVGVRRDEALLDQLLQTRDTVASGTTAGDLEGR